MRRRHYPPTPQPIDGLERYDGNPEAGRTNELSYIER
ncbi:hypothetical protein FB390_6672 [Nocardia bhagyanarayanae]|uniref:Uncharacterized protein n=1 Tax=Nocardia bhagyanarayanae TaxID=1215925 RepID=A0A543EY36_9NOCA|nr:hypothetical protein FB390_6672 [Nocardia bhagyanarayanae]